MENVFFARQPILDVNNNTYGYELLYRNQPGVNQYTGDNGDISTADVINNAFFLDNITSVLDGKKAFVNFTGNLIERGVPKMISSDILVVELLESVVATPEIIKRCLELKKLGYILALDDYEYNDSTKALFDLADIVKLDFRSSREAIERTASKCIELNKTMLAEKVETQLEVEYAKRLGCSYMQGYFFAKPLLMTHKANTPMAKTFLHILGLVYSPDPDYEEIAAVISTDVVLTIRLLRLINLMYGNSGNKISTIHQALVMLGFEKLKEWIYLVGLQRLQKDTPDELIRLALFRAKFCESVSKVVPGAYIHRKEMYLMGLMSIVAGTTDEKSINSVMKELPVTDEIKNGLIGADGLYGDVFRLVVDYEHADWNKVEEFVKKYDVDAQQLANEYVKCIRFMQQFYIK
ncbi:MAG: HDOD domain-containing protein [Ruminiclostridium sp.]|nr:HDOD domain-containing protein [Ruminiclostridium sp.]